MCNYLGLVRVSDRQRAEHARDERRRIEAAAPRPYATTTAQDAYAGLAKPDIAYPFASILDLFSVRYSEQPDALKHEVLFAADTILSDSEPN